MLEVYVKEKWKQELITEQKTMKLDGWSDKPLHGQYLSRTEEKGVTCWRWLQTGFVKKEAASISSVNTQN